MSTANRTFFKKHENRPLCLYLFFKLCLNFEPGYKLYPLGNATSKVNIYVELCPLASDDKIILTT